MNVERWQKMLRRYAPKDDEDDFIIDKGIVQFQQQQTQQQQLQHPRQGEQHFYENEQYYNQAHVVIQNNQQYPPIIPGYNATQIGLMNIGSTCYMNSILQCILRLPKLINAIRQHPKQTQFTQQFIKLSDYLLRKQNVPRQELVQFKQLVAQENAQFNGSEQQDSSEFLLTILNRLHQDQLQNQQHQEQQEFNSINEMLISTYLSQEEYYNASPIKAYLTTSFIIQTTCKQCSVIKYQFESTISTDIIMPKDDVIDVKRQNEDVKCRCNQCNSNQRHLKQYKIIRMPQYLIFNLRRFKKLNMIERMIKNKFYEKDCSLIQINHVLTIPQTYFRNMKNAYYLKGFVDHKGNESSGHYTAYSFDSGEWNFYNDQKAQLCPLQVIVNILHQNSSAYNLIYEQYQ